MTFKYVEKEILIETGWFYGLKSSKYIVSYCEKCECQTIHYLVKDCYNKMLFECSFCKEIGMGVKKMKEMAISENIKADDCKHKEGN